MLVIVVVAMSICLQDQDWCPDHDSAYVTQSPESPLLDLLILLLQ